jgi:cytochrome c-type biogenesis protein
MFDSGMILDATLLPAMAVALVAGLLSFLSPCVLPIVPPYLAYMGGVSVSEMKEARAARRKALLAAAFFVLGLSTVFLLLGAAASAFGRALLAWQGWFVPVAGVVIMLFGAHFLGVLRIPFLSREARIEAGDRGGSALGAYVLGLAFAFGWTPCLGPIWAPSWASPRPRPTSRAAWRCWPPMRWAWASRSCSWRRSSRASAASWAS